MDNKLLSDIIDIYTDRKKLLQEELSQIKIFSETVLESYKVGIVARDILIETLTKENARLNELIKKGE